MSPYIPQEKSNVVRCSALVPLIYAKRHNWHTVMTCQGRPFCSQTQTRAFQRQPFIPESTDHSEIMPVVRSQVGNV